MLGRSQRKASWGPLMCIYYTKLSFIFLSFSSSWLLFFCCHWVIVCRLRFSSIWCLSKLIIWHLSEQKFWQKSKRRINSIDSISFACDDLSHTRQKSKKNTMIFSVYSFSLNGSYLAVPRKKIGESEQGKGKSCKSWDCYREMIAEYLFNT